MNDSNFQEEKIDERTSIFHNTTPDEPRKPERFSENRFTKPIYEGLGKLFGLAGEGFKKATDETAIWIASKTTNESEESARKRIESQSALTSTSPKQDVRQEAITANKEPAETPSDLTAIIADLSRRFVTVEQARSIARMTLPEELRNLNASGSNISGNILKLDIGNSGKMAYWGMVDEGGGTGAGGIDYDFVYVGGVQYAVATPKTSDFLQVNNDGTTEWVLAMPATMPSNAEVYDVTKNQIHLPGETAG